MRLACKWWNKIISDSSFIANDFLGSKSSLLIQVPFKSKLFLDDKKILAMIRSKSPEDKKILAIIKSKLRKSNDKAPIKFRSKLLELNGNGLEYELKQFGIPHMGGRFRSNCNGLILLEDPIWEKELLVVNMLTKCKVSLPICESFCTHSKCSSSLVFNPDLKQYKVIHINDNRFGFEIFTLGSSENEWKVIHGPIIENEVDNNRPWTDPVSCSNGRFLHWDILIDHRYILSMDTCNEKTRKTHLPFDHYNESFDREKMSFIEMGGYLSLVYKVSTKKLDIWVLKDFQNNIWEISFRILAESITYNLPKERWRPKENEDAYFYEDDLPNFEKLKPVCSLREGEVIVFKQMKSHYLYMYETKLMKLKKMTEMQVKDYNLMPYKGSLVYWDSEEELLTRETI